jgi:hypothetical protein
LGPDSIPKPRWRNSDRTAVLLSQTAIFRARHRHRVRKATQKGGRNPRAGHELSRFRRASRPTAEAAGGHTDWPQVKLRASFQDCDGLWWAWLAERELLPPAAKLRIG